MTGTLLSGQLALEDAASLLPGLPGLLRVRGIQVYGKAADKVAAGQRVAVNLAGVDTEQVSRGMVLCRHEELAPTRTLDVELSLLAAMDSSLPKRKTCSSRGARSTN